MMQTEPVPHFVPGESLSPETIERRRNHLGASEIAAVCGLDDYRSPLDIWLSKRGLAEPFEGNEFTEWGHRFEDAIARKYADIFGATIVRAPTVFSPEHDWMSASPDRLASLLGFPVRGLEVKNKDGRQIIHFGDEGTDQIPHAIALQCHWSMQVTGIRTWDIAVLFGGNHFRWYRIEYDEDIAGMAFERGREFWFSNVIAGVEPAVDGSQAWAKHLKSRFAQRTETLRPATQDEDQLIIALGKARSELKRIESEESLLENQLKAAIGEDAGIVSPSGRCTWKAPKDTITVDYESIAIKTLNAFPEDQRAEILAGYTSIKKNSRRFLPTFPRA